ncbi:STAS domain-containing protein [bacterium]|nr:STAS domain-containing protein [bacterium]
MAYFDLEEYGDYCVVRIFLGVISLDYVEELERQLGGVLASATGNIVLDLGDVEGVAPEALYAFNRVRLAASEQNREVAIAAAGPEVLQEIRAMGPAFTVPCYSTLDEVFQKQSALELSAVGPAAGQLFCDRHDCVFNKVLSREDARHVCTHEYAQMIGNPRSCKYFRVNWVEVAGETDARLGLPSKAGGTKREEAPAPPPIAVRTIYEIDHAQGPLDQAPPAPRMAAPAPPRAPAEAPSAVVKRYIEAANSMNFEAEADCLAPALLGGSRQDYIRRRREVFENLARSGPVPQYYFLRLHRENVIEGEKATVDCVRGEVDSLGRRELRQVFRLARLGDSWKITSISSGGHGPRPLPRRPKPR